MFKTLARLIVNEIIITPFQTSNKEFHYKIMSNVLVDDFET